MLEEYHSDIALEIYVLKKNVNTIRDKRGSKILSEWMYFLWTNNKFLHWLAPNIKKRILHPSHDSGTE